MRRPCWRRLLRHRWLYFVDGGVCRVCDRCHTVQYDLPGVSMKGVQSN